MVCVQSVTVHGVREFDTRVDSLDVVCEFVSCLVLCLLCFCHASWCISFIFFLASVIFLVYFYSLWYILCIFLSWLLVYIFVFLCFTFWCISFIFLIASGIFLIFF
jgi:hypothetical protein